MSMSHLQAGQPLSCTNQNGVDTDSLDVDITFCNQDTLMRSSSDEDVMSEPTVGSAEDAASSTMSSLEEEDVNTNAHAAVAKAHVGVVVLASPLLVGGDVALAASLHPSRKAPKHGARLCRWRPTGSQILPPRTATMDSP